MIRCFIFSLLAPLFLFANLDEFSAENNDPTIVHNVNVITGHLQLSFQDLTATGAVSIPLTRSYSSSGALESLSESRILGAVRGGWMMQTGWNLFSHVNLLILPTPGRRGYRAYLREPNGSLVAYTYSHKQHEQKTKIFLKPIQKIGQVSGHLSARSNPSNNLLQIDLKKGEAILFLPDGGKRIYEGISLYPHDNTDFLGRHFYLLKSEVLPSKHYFSYHYDSKKNLQAVKAHNPSGTKTYATIDFDFQQTHKQSPFRLQASTSDNKKIDYLGDCCELREYISGIESNCRPLQKAEFTKARKGIGSRLASLNIAEKNQLKVEYYTPIDRSHEKKWVEDSSEAPFCADKVAIISLPANENGQEKQIAQFFYSERLTTVLDYEGLITQYHHDGEKLDCIRYFNPSQQLHSMQKFYWLGGHLSCKVLFDEKGTPLLAKTFSYEGDNVIEELLYGNLTGNPDHPLSVSFFGTVFLSGGESYRKTYSYYKENHNLLKSSCEENGPTYEYLYKQDTDLLTAKLTKDQEGNILLRNFYFYDEDNLSIKEITDNGTTTDPYDFTGVTQRLEKTTERNRFSGLPETIIDSYWDPITQQEHLLKKTKLQYEEQKVTEEEVYDANDSYRYTLYTEYDSFGNVKRSTNPLGQENLYFYNSLGLLEKSVELGSTKLYQYDALHRLIASTDVENDKRITTSYDPKGRVLSQTNAQGNTTHYEYDAFGNRHTTRFSKTEVGEPIMRCTYNLQGDLLSATMPEGETIKTSYNILHKPIHIIQPDGTEIRHLYSKNGLLLQTTYSDGTRERYDYDILQRVTAKKVYAENGDLLQKESFTYNAFQQLSATDARGITTYFFYDGAGRKIREEKEGRIATFSYDPLGFLERKENEAFAVVQKHNLLGLIEEQYEEDSSGKIENRMRFYYDEKNRKNKAERITSVGTAVDYFEYFQEKLTRHTDPKGAVTQFIWNENKVLEKTTIDPIGNQKIETYDVAGRLVSTEKRDHKGDTVGKERLFYDLSGNLVKRTSYVYLHGKCSREVSVFWKYDAMGRIVEEIEPLGKITYLTYDLRGRLKERLLPSNVKITFSYDPLSRLLTEESSDDTLHLEYHYNQGGDLIKITDHVEKTTLERSYNSFGEIVYEKGVTGSEIHWEYDNIGRCTLMRLPDRSSIGYPYKGSHMSGVQRRSSQGELLYEHKYQKFDPNGHVEQEELIFEIASIHTEHDLLERPEKQSCRYLQQSIVYGPSGLVNSVTSSLFGEIEYSYDALNQLQKEGEESYRFDSLGNPEGEINDLHQILAKDSCRYRYDENGALMEKASSNEKILYNFDALSRLKEIVYPEKKKLCYLYDPLSRLYAKEIYQWVNENWEKESRTLFLYDQNKEIGTLNEEGKILQLKVLGLAIKGDIGGAVAIEIGTDVYAPLHDFYGNIVALISSEGYLTETYHSNAFGKELTSSTPVNPWRFASKRVEEDLVFFGIRFYDPSLGRWITPDPLGCVDGPNLYLYVHNNPLNRLDLFGLITEDRFTNFTFTLDTNFKSFGNQLIHFSTTIDEVEVDFLISCGNWKALTFSPQEEKSGKFTPFDHPEIMSGDGKIGLVTYGNGVNTSFKEFYDTCEWIKNKIPGTLFIGQYHRTEGLTKDLGYAMKEIYGVETFEVSKTQQFLLACSEGVQKISPAVFVSSGAATVLGTLWMHINHSRGGVIDLRAIEKMKVEQQQNLQVQLLLTSVAPAAPTAKHFGLEVVNYYSNQDFITGGIGNPEIPLEFIGRLLGGRFGSIGSSIGGMVGSAIGKHLFNHSDCEIKFVNCTSTWSERTFGADHAILGGTYKSVISNAIKENNQTYGFKNGNNR